jgi:hypothetical protein
MRADVDLHDQHGHPLGTAREATEYRLATPADTQAQARIDAIIAANLK